MDINEKMDKLNRYWTLHAQSVAYTFPKGDKLELTIVPPYLYSVIPNELNRAQADAWVFNAFLESGRVSPRDDVPGVGGSGFTRTRPSRSRGSDAGNVVDSRERTVDGDRRQYVFWTDETHLTAGDRGLITPLDPEAGPEQFVNPIGMAPVVNLRKDTDNEFWATQFDDTVELSLALMLGWSDLLSIAKNQGFSILQVISEDEPKQLTVGINKAVWLKIREGAPTPSLQYTQSNSPISEYKDMLMDLLGLMLSTANMNPKEIGGAGSGGRSFSSGFQALIESADILEARKQDMNPMRRAEQEQWEIIKRWHNWMFDTGSLSPEMRKMGKFSDSFGVSIKFADVAPLESRPEKIKEAKDMLDLGLATKADALKIINPDMSDEQIEQKLETIKQEKEDAVAKMALQFGQPKQLGDDDGKESQV
jgi:hypothetical protein